MKLGPDAVTTSWGQLEELEGVLMAGALGIPGTY
jgi:hypothetical protein